MGKKGFMMAELVVVSSIVMVSLAALYISYSKIFTKYYSYIDYYDSDTLYELAYCRDILIDANMLNELLMNTTTSKIINNDVSESGYDTTNKIVLIHNRKQNIDNYSVPSGTYSNTFNEYIEYLQNSVDLTKSNYVMIMERCITADDCKYGYLEVYDGTE